jgi:hypothetical protein
VQCESYHGPHSEALKVITIKNKEYERSEVLSAGLVIPTETTCRDQCHNPENPRLPASYTVDIEATRKTGTREHIPLKYQH